MKPMFSAIFRSKVKLGYSSSCVYSHKSPSFHIELHAAVFLSQLVVLVLVWKQGGFIIQYRYMVKYCNFQVCNWVPYLFSLDLRGCTVPPKAQWGFLDLSVTLIELLSVFSIFESSSALVLFSTFVHHVEQEQHRLLNVIGSQSRFLTPHTSWRGWRHLSLLGWRLLKTSRWAAQHFLETMGIDWINWRWTPPHVSYKETGESSQSNA